MTHCRHITLMGGILGLLLAVLGHATAHGQVADSVRQRAMEAFHGPDGQGKDGPLAPVGFDLALLYAEWRAYQAQGNEGAFSPHGSLPVRDGHVTVDATAERDAVALQDSLEALGLTNGAQAGVIVSGRLPIASIPAAAALTNLRALRPAQARTNRGAVGPTGSARPQVDTATAASAIDSTAVDAGHGEEEAGGEALSTYWIGGVVILIIGLLYFLLQRDL